jgi:hypothetical protein
LSSREVLAALPDKTYAAGGSLTHADLQRRTATVAKQTKGEVIVVGFNYSTLDTQVAEKVQSAAERIKGRVKRTLEDIIEVGNDLLTVKEALPHGGFLPWLRAEFGWGERMAQNFIAWPSGSGPNPK